MENECVDSYAVQMLFNAVKEGDVARVRACVSPEIVNARSSQATPLSCAVLMECNDIVRVLLDGGANPFSNFKHSTHRAQNALIVAAKASSFDSLELILNY